MKIPLDKIIVGSRQRVDIGDLTDLDTMADATVGLICPIIVHKTLQGYELVDGRRRLAKAERLGWKDIEAYEKDQLTPSQKQIMEFVADVSRKDRTWQEIAISVERIATTLNAETNKPLTTRALEIICSYDHTYIAIWLNIAEALLREPRDEELWSQATYRDAYKLLLARAAKQSQDELNRRAQVAAQLLAQPTLIEESSPGLVDLVNTTDEKIHIRIHGHLAFPEGQYPCVIAYLPDANNLPPMVAATAKFGFLFPKDPREAANFFREAKVAFTDRPLIWNRLQAVETPWPFYVNTEYCLCYRNDKEEPTPFPDARSGIFPVPPTDDELLPREIIAALVEATTTEGMAVLCIGGVNPVHIAELGRVPVWVEKDEEAYKMKHDALKTFYEENIPNCEIL